MFTKPTGLSVVGVTLLSLFSVADAQPPVPKAAVAADQNVIVADEPEVLDGAPLHEAFARPLALEAQAIVVDRSPPEPINELPPEDRPEGSNVHWLPGYWYFDVERDDFVWISGLWRNFPPGRTWVPGEWQQVEAGFQWVAGYWAEAQAQEQQLLPLPPPTLEVGPSSPAPAANYLWAPGCWQWQGASYAWQAGYWYAGQPNWVWVPSHYSFTPRGVVYVRGYWDYPLVRRGLLCAPVYWGPGFRLGTGFAYRPHTFINSSLLVTNLFLDHHHGRYYYGRGWAAGGNLPPWLKPWSHRSYSRWGRYHGGNKIYDPLWTHFRWDGHGRNVHGKFRHQDLARTRRVTTKTTRNDLFRDLDRLSVAQRKALKLHRNNADELTKFRTQAKQLQQFDRSKVLREQIAKGKQPTRIQTQRSSQLAGAKDPTVKRTQVGDQGKRTQTGNRTSGRSNRDRVVTSQTPANDRSNNKNATIQHQTNLAKQQARNQAAKRQSFDARARTRNQTKTASDSNAAAQLRRNAQLRSNSLAKSADQRGLSTFQSQLAKQRETTRSLQNSNASARSLQNQKIQQYLNSRMNRNGFSRTTTNNGRPSIRTPYNQRAAKPSTLGSQTTTRPQNFGNFTRSSRNTTTNTQSRPSYRPSTRNAFPSAQQSQQAGRSVTTQSRNFSGSRNVGRQVRSSFKKAP